jgi:hypothetical protein
VDAAAGRTKMTKVNEGWSLCSPTQEHRPYGLYATKRGERPRSLAVGVSLPHDTTGRH